MYQADENETAVLDAAGGLLAQVHRGVRMLDVFRELIQLNTRNTQALSAWADLEAAITEMGRAQHPEAYCHACEGRGELMTAGSRCCDGTDCGCYGRPSSDYMDACMACMGRGFLGYPVRDRVAPPAPALYSPGDELLEPTF